MTARLVAIAAVLLAGAGTAWAHQSSVAYSQLRIDDGGDVNYTLRLSSRDLYEALGLDRDRDASDEEITAGAERLTTYVFTRLKVSTAGRPCPLETRGLRVLHQTDRFAELRFVAHCPPPLAELALDYDLFFDLDPRHVGMLQVSHGDRSVNQELSKNLQRFEWKALAGAAPKSLGLADYIGKGIEHIYTGYDHIAFLIGLLLVAAIRARLQPAGWEPRGLRVGIPYVLKIVTAFTIAHSITLILASLDVVELPSRFVESSIAASIVWVALENVWLGDPRHRWPLAFGFGLVHGMGFAAMLRPILPTSGVVVPLLAFNLGVELGQLSIVVALYPILHMVARADAGRYRRLVVLYGSALVGAFGSVWLVERIFDIKLISRFFG